MIRRELAIFLIVGSLTVLIDFVTYRCLYGLNLTTVNAAKAAGFLVGTVFAYFANRIWTFGHNTHASGSAWRFLLLYTVTLLANVTVNTLALKALFNIKGDVQLAFLLATGISATLNFLGMKWFVFKSKSISEPA